VDHDRVSIVKFESRTFKRGLAEDEEAVPVVDKVGPYIVSCLIFNSLLGEQSSFWSQKLLLVQLWHEHQAALLRRVLPLGLCFQATQVQFRLESQQHGPLRLQAV